MGVITQSPLEYQSWPSMMATASAQAMQNQPKMRAARMLLRATSPKNMTKIAATTTKCRTCFRVSSISTGLPAAGPAKPGRLQAASLCHDRLIFSQRYQIVPDGLENVPEL